MADAPLSQDRSAVTGLAAGDLNRQILIRKRGAGVDALNRPNGAFATFLTLWASHRTQTGMGRVVNENISATIGRHSWRIRYREDITIDMIVTYGGKDFPIVDIAHDFANQEWTDLICNLGTLA